MKVLHIVPSAFNYFDEIRSEAFAILEEENKLGIDANVITLEFGTTTKKEKEEVKSIAPNRQFIGQQSLADNARLWDQFDIVNLHCPFFGAASQILNWAKTNSKKGLVVTYHGDFKTPDFFSLIIKFYLIYYLPKVFSIAKAVCFLSSRRRESLIGIRTFKNDEKAFVLGGQNPSLDIHNGDIVPDLIMVYNNIMLTNAN